MPEKTPAQVADAQPCSIGQAAKLSGVSPANIRFYEQQGLLAAPARGDNSYRSYNAPAIHQLRFIRLCRALDMSLDEVRRLLGLDLASPDDCAAARDALDGHVAHVRARLKELRALEKDLLALRNRCDGSDDTCHIIEALHAEADALPARPTEPAPRRHV